MPKEWPNLKYPVMEHGSPEFQQYFHERDLEKTLGGYGARAICEYQIPTVRHMIQQDLPPFGIPLLGQAHYQLDYVVTLDGVLRVGTGHTFLARRGAQEWDDSRVWRGLPVLAAGRIYYREGFVRLVDNTADEYQPHGQDIKVLQKAFGEALIHFLFIDPQGHPTPWVMSVYSELHQTGHWFAKN